MDILAACFADRYKDNVVWYLSQSWPEGQLTVCDGDRTIGYLGSMRSEGSSTILILAVHPLYRRRGAGTMLIDAFMDISYRGGCGSISLNMDADDSGAMVFYIGNGFMPTVIINDYYGIGRDAVRMAASAERNDG